MSNNFHTFEKIRMAILGPAPDWSWESGLHGALGFFVPGRVCPMSGWNRGVFGGTNPRSPRGGPGLPNS